jgi:hypothetical protein
LFHISGIFCTSFHERYANLISKSLKMTKKMEFSSITKFWSAQIYTCQYPADNSSLHRDKIDLPLLSRMTLLYLQWDQTCFQPEVCSHYH